MWVATQGFLTCQSNHLLTRSPRSACRSIFLLLGCCSTSAAGPIQLVSTVRAIAEVIVPELVITVMCVTRRTFPRFQGILVCRISLRTLKDRVADAGSKAVPLQARLGSDVPAGRSGGTQGASSLLANQSPPVPWLPWPTKQPTSLVSQVDSVMESIARGRPKRSDPVDPKQPLYKEPGWSFGLWVLVFGTTR